jgi:hypothetical protein
MIGIERQRLVADWRPLKFRQRLAETLSHFGGLAADNSTVGAEVSALAQVAVSS